MLARLDRRSSRGAASNAWQRMGGLCVRQKRPAEQIDRELAIVSRHVAKAGQIGSALVMARGVEGTQTNDEVAEGG